MTLSRRHGLVVLATSLLSSVAFAAAAPNLSAVASNPRQWTGVALSHTGRVFVCFPRWSADVPISVGELGSDADVRAYPDSVRNAWRPGEDPAAAFVCVQSVVVDTRDRLWILDAGNAWLRGVVPGGAKLMVVDLATNQVVRVYPFAADVAPSASYLNDVRIDARTETAYLTESGMGALIVLDLATGAARRLLAGDPSTRAENIVLTIDGEPFPAKIHADGIALDGAGEWLYYQALTGRTLYRVRTDVLRDRALAPAQVRAAVEVFATSGPSDGLLWAPEGIYVSAIEENAIKLVDARGRVRTVARDPSLLWPDSFAGAPDGSVWVTTSQIHLGQRPALPYRLLRLAPRKR